MQPQQSRDPSRPSTPGLEPVWVGRERVALAPLRALMWPHGPGPGRGAAAWQGPGQGIPRKREDAGHLGPPLSVGLGGFPWELRCSPHTDQEAQAWRKGAPGQGHTAACARPETTWGLRPSVGPWGSQRGGTLASGGGFLGTGWQTAGPRHLCSDTRPLEGACVNPILCLLRSACWVGRFFPIVCVSGCVPTWTCVCSCSSVHVAMCSCLGHCVRLCVRACVHF